MIAEGHEADERQAHAPSRAMLDPLRPQGYFVEHEPSATGEIVSVATILLTNRECPWRCVYCDLWKGTTIDTVPRGAIPTQIDYALDQLPRDTCRHLKLYNAGSFFDPNAVPPEDFPDIVQRLQGFDHVIVECHPALINESAVRFRDLLFSGSTPSTGQRTTLEVAMGLEVADDTLLNKLNKRMTLAMFRRACQFLVSQDITVRSFVIVKPPFVQTHSEALNLAKRSIDFAFECGSSIVSLIPARFGPKQLDTLAHIGDFSPPTFETVEDCFDYGISSRRGRVLADLWDIAKLDIGSTCVTDRAARLREMNLQQQVLPRIPCTRNEQGLLAGSRPTQRRDDGA
jgi:archaeosine synthase beta-subunit